MGLRVVEIERLKFLASFQLQARRVKSGRPPINEYHSGPGIAARPRMLNVSRPRYGTSI